MQRHFGIVIAFILTISVLASAQMGGPDKSKRPSPPAQANCKFADGKTMAVDYSSPRAKGRKIFGSKDEKALVPYGEVWRTGANEATTLTTTAATTVDGKDVPEGSYTLFTIPNSGKWTLIISKQTGEWGIPYPGEKSDLARVDMKVANPPSAVENFTIDFDQMGDSCTMHVNWADSGASVQFAEKK